MSEIPDAAVQAAGQALQRYMVGGEDMECVPGGMVLDAHDGWVRAIDGAAETAMPAVLAAALPHLITDEMVEAAAGALWDHREMVERRWRELPEDRIPHEEGLRWAEVVEGGFFPGSQREVRAEARAALEAALGGTA